MSRDIVVVCILSNFEPIKQEMSFEVKEMVWKLLQDCKTITYVSETPGTYTQVYNYKF